MENGYLKTRNLENRNYQYDMWMSSIEHFGARRIFRLSSCSGLGADLGAFLYHAKENELRSFLAEHLGENRNTDILADLLLHAQKAVPEAIAESLWKKKISYVSINDPAFPEKLRSIPDPPFQLYYYGSLPDAATAGAAIVGTRMPSIYGKEQARRFSVSLASAGVQIISGMARGVDGIAGMGCLDAGGRSFAVLGGGVDICYPAENRELYEALKEHGGVLSEYNPGLLPQNRFFPARNRIISGLSDVVLVIEAKERSGSLITADQALEQGCEVFAVPGRNGDRTSSGCNNLIRQGAGIAIDPEDILQVLPGYSAYKTESSGQLRMTDSVVQPQDSHHSDKELRNLRQLRAKTIGDARADNNMALIYAPAVIEIPQTEIIKAEVSQSETSQSEISRTEASMSEASLSQTFRTQASTSEASLSEISRSEVSRTESSRSDLPGTELSGESPTNERECFVESLSRLDREILSVLDRSTPYDLEIIASAVSQHMKKQVTGAEVIREMTCLILRGLAAEVRIGYYVRS